MRVLIMVLFMFSLGCSCKNTIIPASTCPAPVFPKEPEYMISKITKDSDTDFILKALMYDVTSMRSLIDQYKVILKSYSVEK